ncbi:LytR/AlgR family response regulator transcription factor [Rugamonas sp. DEMB1]|uniref:LytR/AlgR family response regulator transcription factor n=1 Tax=Rugamonas sp. DEMB1 TaxID=3039386 RepID=UPI00244684C4|nr:response regulator transcription factor [Rugamonas sp. DEMB1]WGG53198.1 response regulator transcription factor [Rugamonas sp. DEMB1]
MLDRFIDYLLKPVNLERLGKTVAKLKATLGAPAAASAIDAVQALLAQLSAQLLPGGAAGGAGAAGAGAGVGMNVGAAAAAGGTQPSAPAPVAAPLQWIRAAHGEETRLIPIEEVIYFQSNDKYTSVFLAGGESLIRTPLRQLREQLDETNFWQIHRSVIVAARHVAGTKTDFRGRLMVQLKGRPEQLVVSRNYVDLFRKM